MTDITELALLVSKAKASVFTLEYISQFEPADIDSDDVDLRFEVDGRDTGTNVSIVDECGQAAKVIVALVEALEKAIFGEDDTCRAAMLQAGNSPAIPDGSASMLRRWLAFGRGMQNAGSQLPHNLIAETESMLAAAPQSPGSEPATVPGKWIPVSERIPEFGVKVLCYPVEDEPIHATFNGQLWLQDVSWSGSDEPIDNVIPVSVTHWMPLPAGPQEVK